MVNTVHYTKFRQNRIKIAKNLGKAVPGFWIGGPLSKISKRGPPIQNPGTALRGVLAIFIRFGRNLVWWTVLTIFQCWATQITRFCTFRPQNQLQKFCLGSQNWNLLFFNGFCSNLVQLAFSWLEIDMTSIFWVWADFRALIRISRFSAIAVYKGKIRLYL